MPYTSQGGWCLKSMDQVDAWKRTEEKVQQAGMIALRLGGGGGVVRKSRQGSVQTKLEIGGPGVWYPGRSDQLC